jgi:hypothetical protein
VIEIVIRLKKKKVGKCLLVRKGVEKEREETNQ